MSINKSYRLLKNFAADEEGVATVWALGWLILCFLIAGLSIDITNAWKVKTLLQSTADAAAHAGAIELGEYDNNSILAAATTQANVYATQNMNSAAFGDVLIDNDVEVGTWDFDAQTFIPLTGSATEEPDAVRIVTRQDGTDGASNVVGTYFLRFVDKNSFTVNATAVVQRFISQCEYDGIISSGIANVSANVTFSGSTCFHGEQFINFSQHVTFEPGTIASTVNTADCGPDIDTSCLNASNPGIEDALRASTMRNTKVAMIDTYLTELLDINSEYQPDYIADAANAEVIYVASSDFDASTLVSGKVYVVSCRPRETIDMGISATGAADPIILSEFVIVGDNCKFAFDSTAHYEDVIIATNATGRQTVSASAGAILGRDDNCTQGGGVVLVTSGDVGFAAQLEANDLEIIAAGDLNLASRANTGDSIHKGSKFYIGGDVRVTTHHEFEGCDGATEPTFDTRYSFRLVY